MSTKLDQPASRPAGQSPALSVALLPPRHTVLDRPALRRLTRQLITLTDLPLASLTLILTDDETSAHFNKLLLNHDGPTDVITQSYTPLPHEPPGLVAELYINLHRAWQVGRTCHGVSPDRELLLYIAHGLNHLAGNDDATPAQRRAMRGRENGWLAKLGFVNSSSRPRIPSRGPVPRSVFQNHPR